MTQKASWLNEQAFHKLHYTSKNGTDFTVELIPGAKWSGAGDINHMNNTLLRSKHADRRSLHQPDERKM